MMDKQQLNISVLRRAMPELHRTWRGDGRPRVRCLRPTELGVAMDRAALTGKHDTRVRRAHQMLNAALAMDDLECDV